MHEDHDNSEVNVDNILIHDSNDRVKIEGVQLSDTTPPTTMNSNSSSNGSPKNGTTNSSILEGGQPPDTTLNGCVSPNNGTTNSPICTNNTSHNIGIDIDELVVIDVNYFPSYKEVPDFPKRLRRFFRRKAGMF